MMNIEKRSEDLRTRRTRKLLREALLELLKEHDLEEISVRDICERAMIHRTTFYKHYVDKYELLNQEIGQMFRDLSAGIPTPREAITAYTAGEPPAHFVRLFQHAAENPTFYRVMLVAGHTTAFRKLIEDYLFDQTQARIRVLMKQNNARSSIPEELLVHYSIGAAVKVLSWWLEQKTPLTPTEMAGYLSRLLAYGLLPVLGIETDEP